MEKPKNHADLLALKQKKLENQFKVKQSFETVTKDVDMSARTVKVIPNTFLFFDHDADVLLPGSTLKTLNERGPLSTSPTKIKNVYAHDMRLPIGKPTLMDERKQDGNQVQYAESKILNNTKGNDALIEYQEGVIDQHSIGFQYMDLDFVSADDDEWTKYMSMLINPDDAEENGYMFLVKEIKQYEFSPVMFGSNELTPYLGAKSKNKDAIKIKVLERIDLLGKQLYSGRQSDEAMFGYELEVLQLKQIINEFFDAEPSVKDTVFAGRRSTTDTGNEIQLDLSKQLFFTELNF